MAESGFSNELCVRLTGVAGGGYFSGPWAVGLTAPLPSWMQAMPAAVSEGSNFAYPLTWKRWEPVVEPEPVEQGWWQPEPKLVVEPKPTPVQRQRYVAPPPRPQPTPRLRRATAAARLFFRMRQLAKAPRAVPKMDWLRAVMYG